MLPAQWDTRQDAVFGKASASTADTAAKRAACTAPASSENRREAARNNTNVRKGATYGNAALRRVEADGAQPVLVFVRTRTISRGSFPVALAARQVGLHHIAVQFDAQSRFFRNRDVPFAHHRTVVRSEERRVGK